MALNHCKSILPNQEGFTFITYLLGGGKSIKTVKKLDDGTHTVDGWEEFARWAKIPKAPFEKMVTHIDGQTKVKAKITIGKEVVAEYRHQRMSYSITWTLEQALELGII